MFVRFEPPGYTIRRHRPLLQYGQDDKSRYNALQSEFFERAAGGLNRREYLLGLVALGGGGSILTWGLKGSKDAKLPITLGPQTGGEPGPRGRK